jgi:hypothetical protein
MYILTKLLAPSKENPRLSARLTVLAIDLTECRPEYLRAHGEVPNEEREPLDERMSRLEAIVNELNDLFSPVK